jgi:hypothetical protein
VKLLCLLIFCFCPIHFIAAFVPVLSLVDFDKSSNILQHVLQHGKPEERSSIIQKLSGQVVILSQQKYASNVVEKCLAFGTPDERDGLIREIVSCGQTFQVCPISHHVASNCIFFNQAITILETIYFLLHHPVMHVNPL